MESAEVTFGDRYGLHPRAAMRIQQEAARFASTIVIHGLGSGGGSLSATSMISMVSAGIRQGERVRITAEGPDEAEAAAAIEGLLAGGVCHP